MIYFTLLVPFSLSLYVWHSVIPRWPKSLNDKRWLLLAAPVVIGTAVVFAGKGLIQSSQTADTEYWTGWAVRTVYDEAWTEEVTITTTDSKGNTTTTIIPVYRPAQYKAVDSNDCEVRVDRDEYARLKTLFGNSARKASVHFNQMSWGDGGRHTSKWLGTDAAFTPMTTLHRYENRVIASHSLFKFPKVEDKSNLYAYPQVHGFYKMPSVLWKGKSRPPGDEALTNLNARLGREKQIKVWLLVFEELPLSTGYDQESYWQGGNKNELVICVGLAKEKVSWCYVFSWTESDACKLDVRDLVVGYKEPDIPAIVAGIEPIIKDKWARKQFHDFDYLSVDPPAWVVIVLLICLLGLSGWYVHFLKEYCR